MSSNLFAFQLAKLLEAHQEEMLSAQYDPQTQTLSWKGEGRPQAVHCTGYYEENGYTRCNAYGSYCHVWNYTQKSTGYVCDN